MHGIGNIYMVGSRLRNDNDTHHRHTVHLHIALDVAWRQFGTTDVAEPYHSTAVFLDNEVVELLRGVHLSHGTDTEFGGIALDGSRRQLHILTVEGILHVHRRDAITRHLHRVEPQTHAISLLTPYHNARNVLNGLQLLLYREVGYLTEFQQRALVALYGHHKYRTRIGIGFRNSWRVAVAWQPSLCSRHLVAHVIGCCFQIYREFKLNRYTTVSLLTDTGQGADARNTVDVLLKGFGYLILYYVGVRTRIRARHRYYRVIHRRIFSYTQRCVADSSEEEYYQREHRGKHRAAY